MAFPGVVIIILLLGLILSKKVSALAALTCVPIIVALVAGFGLDTFSFAVKGIQNIAPVAAMFIFAIVFFGVLTDAGMFDPIINRILRMVRNDPARITVGAAMLAMIVHLDGSGAVTFLITIPAILPLVEKLKMDRRVLAAVVALGAGDAEIIVAGGMENMSAAPFVLDRARWGYRMGDGTLVDTMINDALTDVFEGCHMGITAENVAEMYGITRMEQDEFAAVSQQRAEKAITTKRFEDEIVPVEVKISNKETTLFRVDEFPRPGVTSEGIAALKPAFKPDGTVTAANASGINDGAAAMVVMNAEKAREMNIQPMARIISFASAGLDPAIMGAGPIHSTSSALEKAGITLEQIGLIEANEAFAAQALAVGKTLGFNPDIVNVNGGAIALGHPVGASGARILVTLLHEMKKRKVKLGLATLCVGGGMGVTTIVEGL